MFNEAVKCTIQVYYEQIGPILDDNEHVVYVDKNRL